MIILILKKNSKSVTKDEKGFDFMSKIHIIKKIKIFLLTIQKKKNKQIILASSTHIKPYNLAAEDFSKF